MTKRVKSGSHDDNGPADLYWEMLGEARAIDDPKLRSLLVDRIKRFHRLRAGSGKILSLPRSFSAENKNSSGEPGRFWATLIPFLIFLSTILAFLCSSFVSLMSDVCK